MAEDQNDRQGLGGMPNLPPMHDEPHGGSAHARSAVRMILGIVVVLVAIGVIYFGYTAYVSYSPKVTSTSAPVTTQASSVPTTTMLQTTVPSYEDWGCNAQETVYVQSSDNCTPFDVLLESVSQPPIGPEQAKLNVYYLGELVNISTLSAGQSARLNYSGSVLNILVNDTFIGATTPSWAVVTLNVT